MILHRDHRFSPVTTRGCLVSAGPMAQEDGAIGIELLKSWLNQLFGSVEKRVEQFRRQYDSLHKQHCESLAEIKSLKQTAKDQKYKIELHAVEYKKTNDTLEELKTNQYNLISEHRANTKALAGQLECALQSVNTIQNEKKKLEEELKKLRNISKNKKPFEKITTDRNRQKWQQQALLPNKQTTTHSNADDPASATSTDNVASRPANTNRFNSRPEVYRKSAQPIASPQLSNTRNQDRRPQVQRTDSSGDVRCEDVTSAPNSYIEDINKKQPNERPSRPGPQSSNTSLVLTGTFVLLTAIFAAKFLAAGLEATSICAPQVFNRFYDAFNKLESCPQGTSIDCALFQKQFIDTTLDLRICDATLPPNRRVFKADIDTAITRISNSTQRLPLEDRTKQLNRIRDAVASLDERVNEKITKSRSSNFEQEFGTRRH